MKELIWLWFYLLVVGAPLFLPYILALLFGLVRIKGWSWSLKKFFPGENGLITYSNHVTSLETPLIPLLLAPFFLVWPKLLIFSVTKKKWYNKWWFTPFRPATILVSPGEGTGAEKSMAKTIAFLRMGKKIVHIYPSGLRLKTTREAKKGLRKLGKREVGRFYAGILAVLLETKSDLLPIWIEIAKWPLITIIIGERIIFSSLGFPDKKFLELTSEEREELLTRLEDILLKTS